MGGRVLGDSGEEHVKNRFDDLNKFIKRSCRSGLAYICFPFS